MTGAWPSVGTERSRDELVKLVGVPIGRSREGHVLVRSPTMRCQPEGSAGRSAALWRPELCNGAWQMGAAVAESMA